jgi:transcriptional regulator with XRE-family HTH domain
MDRDWVRLGKALQAARKAKGLRQPDVAAALHISLATVQAIERGHEFAKPTPSVRAFARLVDWTEASVDQVLAGGDPNHVHHAKGSLSAVTSLTASASAERPEGPPQLPLRIVDELEDDGALLDSTVVHLGDGTRMVVVVKGQPGASPEEIRRNLEAWRRTQPKLEQLSNPSADPSEIPNEA